MEPPLTNQCCAPTSISTSRALIQKDQSFSETTPGAYGSLAP